MPRFSTTSLQRLATCDPRLREIALAAVARIDFGIACGYRGEDEQNAAFDRGASQTRFPDSKHNATAPDGSPCALAFDFVPWPLPDSPADRVEVYAFVAGVLCGVARAKGIALRWGGDWDGDENLAEHTLRDRGHVEID